MRLFYDPNIETGEHHVLREEESHHCTKVLRLKSGDELFITDGKGTMHKCEIIEIHQKRSIVKIIDSTSNYGNRNYKIHIAIAPTKSNDRYEWFLEKATEIGIDEVTPIICKNSERKVVKTARLERVVESAMKQSYKAYHPVINEQVSFDSFLKQEFEKSQKFIAHCETDKEKIYLGSQIEKKSTAVILIGPEGDFNDSEIKLAKEKGFIPISLGESRLRTETAGVVACDICSVINQL